MATKKIKKVTQKQKQKQTQKQKQKQTSKAIGNIVNINVPQAKKRQYTRRQPSKPSQPSTSSTSVVTQIHQMPIPQYPVIMSELLGTNNLKSAQLQGDLGIVRNNEINNQSPLSIGGNQDAKILTSAERADALMKSIASKQPENLLKILNEEDNIPVPRDRPLKQKKITEMFKPSNRVENEPRIITDIPKFIPLKQRLLTDMLKPKKEPIKGIEVFFEKNKNKIPQPEPGEPMLNIFDIFKASKPIDIPRSPPPLIQKRMTDIFKSIADREIGLQQTSKNEDKANKKAMFKQEVMNQETEGGNVPRLKKDGTPDKRGSQYRKKVK